MLIICVKLEVKLRSWSCKSVALRSPKAAATAAGGFEPHSCSGHEVLIFIGLPQKLPNHLIHKRHTLRSLEGGSQMSQTVSVLEKGGGKKCSSNSGAHLLVHLYRVCTEPGAS